MSLGVIPLPDRPEKIDGFVLKSSYDRLQAENAKLRELVLDYFNAPCLECNPWDGGWEGCKHCESGNCTLAIRTLELGIELAE